MGAVFIVLIGLTFLLKALDVIAYDTADLVWPTLLILFGLQKMMKGMCKCCGSDASCCKK